MGDQQNPKGVVDMRPARHQEPARPGEKQSRAVFIDPRVNPAMLGDPETAAYAAGLGARAQQRRVKAAGLPKYQQEVGGGPVPNIPLLNQEAAQGVPMAQQASQVNQMPYGEMMQQAGQAIQSGSIVEPPMHIPRMNTQQQAQQAIINSIQPGDMLTSEAQQDPTFQQGTGSQFAANQPHLVLKYGLVRGGQVVTPQQLAQSSQARPGQLSAKSVEGLQALQNHQRQAAEGMPQTEEQAEKQAAAGAAAQSSRVGKPYNRKEDPEGQPEGSPEDEEKKRKIQEAIEKMDSFDYDALRREMEEDILNNPEQREIIEARLKPLDFDELVTKNRVTQDVVIHPGTGDKKGLWFTYESMTGEEDLVLKQIIMKESKSIEVTGQYLLDKFAFMSIAIGLKAINGHVLPRHTNDQGEFDEDKFWVKFHWVLQKPLHLLSCIGINHTWFETRVRKMFVAEKLGNG